MMKLKKNLYKKRKVKLVIHVNELMNSLKFNNMFFFLKLFFNYMIKRKIHDDIIKFNLKKKYLTKLHTRLLIPQSLIT